MPRNLLADRPPRNLLAGMKSADSKIPYAETAATMLTGAIAEPIAGLAGLRAAIEPGPPGAGAQAVKDTREALTYRSDAPNSQAAMQSVSETIAPVTDSLGRAQKQFGALGEEIGGPVGGAIGETIPTALLTLVGIRRAPTQSLKSIPLPKPGTDIVRAGEAADVPVLTSDVRPPQTWLGKQAQSLGEKIPIAGTGPVRAEQQAARQAAVERVADQYGQFSYTDVVENLKSQKNKVKAAAGSVLESTGAKLDTVGPMPMPRTQRALADLGAATSKPGVVSVSGKATDDADALSQAFNTPQTFTTLKENRTAYRSMKDGIDPVTGSQMPSNTKRLAEGVYQAMTEDMKDFAKTNLSPREYAQWSNANAIYADEAQKLTKTRLKQVLDKGDLTPENVETLLFSKKPSDVRLLHGSLSESGRSHVRAAIISKVVERASSHNGGFGPNQFLNELNKQGIAVETFFKGTNRKQLEGLRKVLEATRRAQDAAANPPTGQMTIPLLTALGVGITGVKGAATVGTLGYLARVYESASVRNLLLRVASAPPSGPVFDRAIAAATAGIAAAANEASNQQEPTEQ